MPSHFSSIIYSEQIQEYLPQSFPRQWSDKWFKSVHGHHLFRLQIGKQFNNCSSTGILQTSVLGVFLLLLCSSGTDLFWYLWHRKIIVPPVLKHIKSWNSMSPCWKGILSLHKVIYHYHYHYHLIFANLAVWKAKQTDTYWILPQLNYWGVHQQDSLLMKQTIFTCRTYLSCIRTHLSCIRTQDCCRFCSLESDKSMFLQGKEKKQVQNQCYQIRMKKLPSKSLLWKKKSC